MITAQRAKELAVESTLQNHSEVIRIHQEIEDTARRGGLSVITETSAPAGLLDDLMSDLWFVGFNAECIGIEYGDELVSTKYTLQISWRN